MGYTTDFTGSFKINKPLSREDLDFLKKLNNTRRMARNVGPEYGVEGEFYVDGLGMCGQGDEENIIDYNTPPRTQPGLWCKWIPNEEGTEILWDGAEKFYDYVEWLQYLITTILNPRGYSLDGGVEYQGEDASDFGKITIVDNIITAKKGKRSFE